MKDAETKELVDKLIDASKDGNYIFRGTNVICSMENKGSGIRSTLHRQYQDHEKLTKEGVEISEMEEVIVDMLKSQLSGYENLSNIEILTDLRQYGSKVFLIDFTLDIYTALFFACNGEFRKEGEVLMLERSNIAHIDDIDYKKPTFGIIKPVPTSVSYKRAMNQNSIFVYAPSGYIDEKVYILETQIIKRSTKKHILKYLEKYHNISQKSVYNDLFGFIENEKNHHASRDKFYQGFLHAKNEHYKKAIELYTEVISMDSNFAAAYINRGGAYIKRPITKNRKNKKLDYTLAIKNYSKAIEVEPKSAVAYLNRGITYDRKGLYREAIKDYNNVIELQSDFAWAYASRGDAKSAIGNDEEAVDDYNEAIRLEPENAAFYAKRASVKNKIDKCKEADKD